MTDRGFLNAGGTVACLLLMLLAAAGRPAIVGAATVEPATPFATTNRNPLVAVYGLPAAGPAAVLETGRTSLELRADMASVSSSDDGRGEQVLLDGESYRFTVALRHGLGERFEVGLELPYVMHRGGFLDGAISDWHDFFDLPQGERDEMPRDRLAYRYARDGREPVALDDDAEGFGDLRLTGAWQLWQPSGADPGALALRGSLKLPTGDPDQLLGSGSTDLALWLSGSRTFGEGGLALFAAAGGMLMSEGDLLPDQQRHAAAFATLGGGWRPLPRLALKLQLDGQTACHGDSDLRELSDSVQLTVGGTVGLTDSLALDLAVSEDLVVDSAPDVTFHFALQKTF